MSTVDCSGTWIGFLRDAPAERQPLVVSLRQDGHLLAGTVGPRATELIHARIADGHVDPRTGAIRFRVVTVEDPLEQLTFEGIVTADQMTGRFTYNDQGTGGFVLRRDRDP